jgi:hypothetical protein
LDTAHEKQSPNQKTSGSVASRTPRRATIALAEALSKLELERSISDTSVMDMVESLTPSPTPQSISSATSTSQSGTGPTVWEWSGQAYVEAGCPQLSQAEWSVLSPTHQFKLRGVAHGRGESPEETIRAAYWWLSEMEAPVAEVGTLLDVVEFYLDNLVM